MNEFQDGSISGWQDFRMPAFQDGRIDCRIF